MKGGSLVSLLAERVYGVLLFLYPKKFRRTFGPVMTEVFRTQWKQQTRVHGRSVWLPILVRTAADVLQSASRQRIKAVRAALSNRVSRMMQLPGRSASSQGSGLRHVGIRGYWDSALQDVRFGIRTLARRPLFSAVAAATLSLGIGATTAIFSVVHGVLLTPLAYPQSERLVQVGHAALDGSFGITNHTLANYSAWKDRAESFELMAAYRFESMTLTGHGDARRVQGVRSVGSVFDVVGVGAYRGRTFTEQEDRPGPEDVVVLSYGLWQQIFGGRTLRGSTVTLDGKAYQVIGVMPPGYQYPRPGIQFWLTCDLGADALATDNNWSYRTVARLAPGRTVRQAAEEMQAIASQLREAHPDENRNVTFQVVALRELLVRNVRTLLWVLMAAVSAVLLIACLNVATLLLARAAVRQQEIAVRQALGASRGRLIRQLLTEGGVLALAGAVGGVAIGWLLQRALVAWLPGGLPRAEEIGIGAPVLGFALLITCASAVLFGGVPAVRLSRASVADRMAVRARGASAVGNQHPVLIAEVVLAVVLLHGAGLLLRSFVSLIGVAPGFETEQRLTFRMGLSDGYPQDRRLAFFRELEERLTTLPGVESVGFTTGIPAAIQGASTRFEPEDGPLAGGEGPGAVYRVVNPGYHQTMGIELIRGRFLTRHDGLGGTPSVVINDVLAESVWPGEDAIGKRLRLRSWERPTLTVVGIVKSVHMFGLNRDPPPVMYWVHELQPWRPLFSVVVHATVDPRNLVGSIRRTVRDMDPHQPIFEINTLEEILSSSVASQRNSMTLLGLLSAVGLVLAVVGVYGLLSFVVNHRQREIGIRVALGADTWKVRGLVVREGMTRVLMGLALGLAGAVALGRFMRSLLFGVSPTDAATLVGVSLVILMAAAVATYLPARRATRVDPMLVMRAE